MKIEKYKEVATDVQKNDFGLIFHKASELFYNTLLPEEKGTVTKEMLQPYIDDSQLLYTFIDKAFMLEYFGQEDGTPQYNGEQLINREVLQCMLGYLVRMDAGHAPFYYEGGELPLHFNMQTTVNDLQISLRIGGRADRLDSKDGTLRIVDYKTGGKADTPADVASLFIPDKKRSNYIFQTFLYAAIMSKKQDLKVAPSLLYIHRAASDSYSPVVCLKEPRKPEIPVTDFSIYEEEFRSHLQTLLTEIFSPEINFEQTTIEEKCTYCDFKTFCKK